MYFYTNNVSKIRMTYLTTTIQDNRQSCDEILNHLMYTCQEHENIIQQNIKTFNIYLPRTTRETFQQNLTKLNVDMPMTTRDNPPTNLKTLNVYMPRTTWDNPSTKPQNT